MPAANGTRIVCGKASQRVDRDLFRPKYTNTKPTIVIGVYTSRLTNQASVLPCVHVVISTNGIRAIVDQETIHPIVLNAKFIESR